MYTYVYVQPPPPTSRPSIKGYWIAHNTTGQLTLNQTKENEFFVGKLPPAIYLFTLWATNLLGDGEASNITGRLLYTAAS